MTFEAILNPKKRPADLSRAPRRTLAEFARELGINDSTMRNYAIDFAPLPAVLTECTHKKYYAYSALKKWWANGKGKVA